MRTDRRRFLTAALTGLAAAARPRAARAQAREPLRVGVVTSLTGSLAVYGTAISRMYQVVAEDINKAGGVGGRPVQLFTEDDQSQPDAGVRGARKLVDVNRVHVLMGTASSAVTLAVAPIAVQSHLLLFTVSSSPAITTFKDNDLMFRTSTSQEFWSGVFALAAKKQNFKTAALLILNNPYGIGLGDAFTERFTKAGGRVTGRVIYNPSQASYRSEIQQALGAKPDVILFGGYTPDGVQIFKEWFQLGLGGVWMGPGFAFSPQFIGAVGAQAAEGIIVVEAAPSLGTAAYQHAERLYRPATGLEVEIFAASAYDHLLITALAVLAARGETGGDALRGQIRRLCTPPGKVVGTWADAAGPVRAGEEVNYEGASGACDFDQNGDTFTDFGIYRVKGGRWALEQTIAAAEVKAI
jgi:branched-chain amino acid transport system substrate-binding protein